MISTTKDYNLLNLASEFYSNFLSLKYDLNSENVDIELPKHVNMIQTNGRLIKHIIKKLKTDYRNLEVSYTIGEDSYILHIYQKYSSVCSEF